MRNLLREDLHPSGHDTTLETELNALIPMELLTSSAERRLVAENLRTVGNPSKHQTSQGVVYRRGTCTFLSDSDMDGRLGFTEIFLFSIFFSK